MATEKSTGTRAAKKAATSGGSSTTKKPAGAKRPAAKGASAPRAAARKRTSASDVAQAAVQQLVGLTGKDTEGVTSLERTEDGWTVQVDVVELRRIPSTTDVLATYEVEVDSDGDLLGYRRVHRYVRGVAGEE